MKKIYELMFKLNNSNKTISIQDIDSLEILLKECSDDEKVEEKLEMLLREYSSL